MRTVQRRRCGGWRATDAWGSLTFDELAEKVARAATGLAALGVGPGDRVVFMMRNIPEFHWVDLAVTFLGATPVSIYNSSAPDQVQYLVGHCRAKVAVVEDEGFLERFLKVRDELPDLGPDRRAPRARAPARRRASVDGADRRRADRPGRGRRAPQQPDDLATIIYTSGTTGNPKGVMLSHTNLVWTGESHARVLRLDPRRGRPACGSCRTCRWPTSPSGWSPTTG